jgi:hypothetical protein
MLMMLAVWRLTIECAKVALVICKPQKVFEYLLVVYVHRVRENGTFQLFFSFLFLSLHPVGTHLELLGQGLA